MKRHLICILAAMMVLCAANVVYAAGTNVLDEDFSKDLANDDSWVFDYNPEFDKVEVVDDGDGGHLLISKPVNLSNAVCYAQKFTNEGYTGTVKVEIVVQTDPGLEYRTIQVRDNSNLVVANLQFYDNKCVDTTQAGTPIVVDPNPDPNEYHHIVWYFYTSNKSYDLFYDGELMVENRAFLWGSNISSFLFHVDTNQTGVMRIKKFKIDIIDSAELTIGEPIFKNADNEELTSLENGEICVEVEGENDTREDQKVTLIVALYENDELADIKFETMELKRSISDSVKCSILCNNKEVSKVKAFVYEDFGNLTYINEDVFELRYQDGE